jgi:uncharacterized protein (UPF0332 family)
MPAQVSLELAEEYLGAARVSLEAERFNAATSSAVHAVICANDAVCLALTGKRQAAKSHDEAIHALQQACAPTRHAKAGAAHEKQLSAVISMKTVAEYGGTFLEHQQAQRAVTPASRFVAWARGVVGGK